MRLQDTKDINKRNSKIQKTAKSTNYNNTKELVNYIRVINNKRLVISKEKILMYKGRAGLRPAYNA